MTRHRASEEARKLRRFNELRNYDRNFTLVKAASDTRTSAIQTDAALSTVNPILTTVFRTRRWAVNFCRSRG